MMTALDRVTDTRSRTNGVQDHEAGLKTRLIFRRAKKRMVAELTSYSQIIDVGNCRNSWEVRKPERFGLVRTSAVSPLIRT